MASFFSPAKTYSQKLILRWLQAPGFLPLLLREEIETSLRYAELHDKALFLPLLLREEIETTLLATSFGLRSDSSYHYFSVRRLKLVSTMIISRLLGYAKPPPNLQIFLTEQYCILKTA
ncbi:hypothetical protein [Dulcicalothrix desertica]|uniref:hypothetical protein n=1 Tax=Dulcicalothrix desertica TaxID=32056 RepID=UPI0039890EA3